jgi:hypothetical protein
MGTEREECYRASRGLFHSLLLKEEDRGRVKIMGRDPQTEGVRSRVLLMYIGHRRI